MMVLNDVILQGNGPKVRRETSNRTFLANRGSKKTTKVIRFVAPESHFNVQWVVQTRELIGTCVCYNAVDAISAWGPRTIVTEDAVTILKGAHDVIDRQGNITKATRIETR